MNLDFTLGSATHKARKDPDTGLVHPYLEIADAKTRAHRIEAAGNDVVVRFRFMGLTDTLAPMGSGIIRSQLAVKLLGQDKGGCNLVYAGWRFWEAEECKPLSSVSKVFVQSKINPCATKWRDCRNKGYDPNPSVKNGVAKVEIGRCYELRCTYRDGCVSVAIDEVCTHVVPFEPPAGWNAVGFAGLRTDNAKLEIDCFKAKER